MPARKAAVITGFRRTAPFNGHYPQSLGAAAEVHPIMGRHGTRLAPIPQ